MKEDRPWGNYEVLLDSDNCKVKRITVYPDGKLSYQYHHHRSEVWTVISGKGILTLEGKRSPVNPGQVIKIEAYQKHRIENTGSNISEDLVFIEVQTGSYFGEDDIIRIEDDYGRSSSPKF